MSSQKLRLISAAVRVNMQFLCCWRLRNQHELEAVIEELSALLPKDKLHRIYEQATREPYSFLFVYYLKPKSQMFYLRFEERFALVGAALSFLGQKLFASSTLINARCENISCCTSVAAVQPPVVRRTGGFLRKGMTTIYVDSRKRVAGSDSDFEVDLEKVPAHAERRQAGRLIWALLPEGAYTGSRLAAWISSNFATATYSETTNSLSVAYDILNDLELQQQFPNVVDYPTSPGASPSKPFSIDHMLGPSFVSGGQQVFEFVRMMAYNEVYLPPAGQRQPRAGQSGGRHRVQDNAEERREHHSGDRLR